MKRRSGGAHVICEDTGLCFADINQFPGALIKFYHKALGNQGIVVHHGGSRCTATTVIGYRNPEGTILDMIKHSHYTMSSPRTCLLSVWESVYGTGVRPKKKSRK